MPLCAATRVSGPAHFAVAGELAAGDLGSAIGALAVASGDHRLGSTHGHGALAVVLIALLHAGLRVDRFPHSIREPSPKRRPDRQVRVSSRRLPSVSASADEQACSAPPLRRRRAPGRYIERRAQVRASTALAGSFHQTPRRPLAHTNGVAARSPDVGGSSVRSGFATFAEPVYSFAGNWALRTLSA